MSEVKNSTKDITINSDQEIIQEYHGSKVVNQIFLQENIKFKYLLISSGSGIDLQFYTQGDNIGGEIYAIFFGDKPLSANIMSHIQNSNSHINVFMLSFVHTDNLINLHGSIELGKNIANSQGHLLEKNVILQNTGDKKGKNIKIKAIPRLDVYSNDVQATHGVSIDRINQEELFYLESKGLSDSKVVIINGYIQNILDKFKDLSDEEKVNIQNTILSSITKQ